MISYFHNINMSQPNKLLYAYPPDLQKCMKHRLATRVFKGLDEDNINEQCECCGRKVGAEQVNSSCCYSNLQLCFLGPGIPLLFSYILSSIVVLIALSLIFSIFAVVTNELGGDCSLNDDCPANIFNTLSIVNKINKDDYLSVQNYVLLAFVVIFIFMMQCFRRNFRRIEEDCDEMVDSPSDYAIILRRLPPLTTEQDIKDMIQEQRGYLDEEQKQRTDNLRVVKIIMSYDMDEYIEEKNNNMKAFKNFVKEHDADEFQPDPLPELVKTETIAIIVFATQQAKQAFLYKPNMCQKTLQCFCEPCVPLSDNMIGDQKIAIERAPEPDDIVWQNAKVSVSAAVWRKVIFNLLCLGLLVIGGAAQYGLAVAQNNEENERTKLLFSLAASILVALMNRIIQEFLNITTKLQKNETLTEYNRVLMIKICFFLFLNSGVFLVAANIIANTSDYSVEGGLSYEITLVMIMNAITPNLAVFFVQTCNLLGRAKVFLLKREWFVLTQLEANKFYQTSYPQIPFKYGYILKTLWLTAFYAPLVPIVVPVSIVGLTFNYWLEKYSYGKSYMAPNMISSEVNDAAIELLEWVPLILASGELLVYLYFKNFNFGELPDYWSIPIYVSLGISVLALLLPMRSINKKFCKLKSDDNIYPPYEKVEEKFEVTYEMTNPAYKVQRKRRRDHHLWHLLFSQGQTTEMNPLQQALIAGNKQNQAPPPPPPQPFQNQNPFDMLTQNQANQNEYPNLQPMYPPPNPYQNTANPFYMNQNL